MNTEKDKKIKLASDIFNYLTYFMLGVIVTLYFLW